MSGETQSYKEAAYESSTLAQPQIPQASDFKFATTADFEAMSTSSTPSSAANSSRSSPVSSPIKPGKKHRNLGNFAEGVLRGKSVRRVNSASKLASAFLKKQQSFFGGGSKKNNNAFTDGTWSPTTSSGRQTPVSNEPTSPLAHHAVTAALSNLNYMIQQSTPSENDMRKRGFNVNNSVSQPESPVKPVKTRKKTTTEVVTVEVQYSEITEPAPLAATASRSNTGSSITIAPPPPPRMEATGGGVPQPRPQTPPKNRRQETDTSGLSSCESPSKKARKVEPGPKILPAQYQFCSTSDLMILISDMLAELVSLNDKLPLNPNGLTRFHSRAPPGISIHDYLSRLSLHLSLEPCILLSMVYYIDILSIHYPAFTISSLTVHRFLITAATVATKGLCDSFLVNSFYARVGGVSLVELNMLELEFLMRVGWRIVPRRGVLEEYYRSLAGRLSGKYRVGEPGECDLRGIGYAGKKLDASRVQRPGEGRGTKLEGDTSHDGLSEELPEVVQGGEDVLDEVWKGWEAFGTPPGWMLGERWREGE